jgi:hypothetical protein
MRAKNTRPVFLSCCLLVIATVMLGAVMLPVSVVADGSGIIPPDNGPPSTTGTGDSVPIDLPDQPESKLISPALLYLMAATIAMSF